MIELTVRLTDEEYACLKAEAERRHVGPETVAEMAIARVLYVELDLADRLSPRARRYR